jgi:hypothetical protein
MNIFDTADHMWWWIKINLYTWTSNLQSTDLYSHKCLGIMWSKVISSIGRIRSTHSQTASIRADRLIDNLFSRVVRINSIDVCTQNINQYNELYTLCRHASDNSLIRASIAWRNSIVVVLSRAEIYTHHLIMSFTHLQLMHIIWHWCLYEGSPLQLCNMLCKLQ